AEIEYSEPYWLAAPPEKGHWTVRDASLIGRPAAPPLGVELSLAVGGTTLSLTRPLVYKWVDPVAGERQRALEVLPPVSVNPRSALMVFPEASTVKLLVVRVKANRADVAGELAPEVPAGWRIEPARQPIKLVKVGDEAELSFRV